MDGVPLARVRDMQCELEVGAGDPAKRLSAGDRMLQKGSAACRAMTESLLEGVASPCDRVLLLDLHMDTKDWAVAASEMQSLCGDTTPAVLFAGFLRDSKQQAARQSEMVADLMGTWWRNQPASCAPTAAGPARAQLRELAAARAGASTHGIDELWD